MVYDIASEVLSDGIVVVVVVVVVFDVVAAVFLDGMFSRC
jgi:hypothetical protein